MCGRWASDVYEIYCRLSKEAASRMASVIGSTAFEDLERGGFVSEELELLPHELAFDAKLSKDMIDEATAE